MADDNVSKYAPRGLGSFGAPGPEPERQKGPSGKDLYAAYDSKDKLTALDIRLADGTARTPSYAYLLDIIYGRKRYSGFVLVFSFMVVTVHGRNLKPVVQALKLRKCEFIEEWSREFEAPENDDPVIESIKIDAPKGQGAMVE